MESKRIANKENKVIGSFKGSEEQISGEQKKAIGILSLGTFLEYFDLMLYVHMAVLLNELFFPKTDPFVGSLIAAFSFCTTYLLRPFGALLFGYIGDTIGRKATVIITTMMMATSCLVMASAPTYAQVGITATWIITICRAVQGISSLGEIVGAKIYLTEFIKSPNKRHFSVSLISVASVLGVTFALFVASLVTSHGFSWRLGFGFGTVIALVGMIARTSLRETNEFVDAKKRLSKTIEDSNGDVKKMDGHTICEDKASSQTIISYSIMESMGMLYFYINFIYCAILLKNKGYLPSEIIAHNFKISSIVLVHYIIITYLSSKIHPLKILQFKAFIFIPFSLLTPYLLSNAETMQEMLIIQIIIGLFRPRIFPASAVVIKHFPVIKRFRYVSWIFAICNAIVSIFSAFGIIFVVKWFGYNGLLIIFIPSNIALLWAINHFRRLEIQKGEYSY